MQQTTYICICMNKHGYGHINHLFERFLAMKITPPLCGHLGQGSEAREGFRAGDGLIVVGQPRRRLPLDLCSVLGEKWTDMAVSLSSLADVYDLI